MTRALWPNAHALVTGGGSGIGAAAALALARDGARVSIVGRRPGPLERMASQLGDSAAVSLQLDVTQEAEVSRGIAWIEAEGGPIDILVNNAGSAGSAPFERTGLALWSQMLTANLTSAFLVAHAVLPGMARRGRGRVVNVASTAGLIGYSYVAAYVAAKHGVVGLTRALALEYARKGITVNAVCPGFTDTALVESAVANIAAKTGRGREDAKTMLAETNPMQRLVQPDEVADTIAWLASAGASAINGQAIAIAGGEVMTG